MELQKNDGFVSKWPRFIKFLRPIELQRHSLKVPDTFIEQCEEDIPRNVRLQLPNGREIQVEYKKKEKAFSEIGMLIKDYLHGDFDMIIVLCYKGDGSFLIYILNDAKSEVEYDATPTIARAPVYTQDTINGVGWKFITLGIGQIFRDGGADVPKTFVERFGNIIPAFITFSLRNGELFKGSFLNNHRKLYGLLPIIRKKYLNLWDIIMFTYCGDGHFEVCIFGRSKVEKALKVEIINIDSDSETEMEDVDNAIVEFGKVAVDEGIDDLDRQFSVTMSVSNTDNTAHGVYIPRHINPSSRRWRAGEEVILRTNLGYWRLGLVYSKELPRFSAGWNRFVRENRIKFTNILIFNLVEEDEEECVFEVEVKENI